jgi:hypothetical protein
MISGGRGPYRPQPARPNRRRAILTVLALAALALFIVDKVNLTPPASAASDVVQAVPFVVIALILVYLARGAACGRRY